MSKKKKKSLYPVVVDWAGVARRNSMWQRGYMVCRAQRKGENPQKAKGNSKEGLFGLSLREGSNAKGRRKRGKPRLKK